MAHVSGLTSHISCLTSPAPYLLSPISCLTSSVSCFLSPISCLTIIKAAKSATVLLISPLYRYATGRCCRLETHLTNFVEEDYTKKLANTLQSLGKQLRSLVWHRH